MATQSRQVSAAEDVRQAVLRLQRGVQRLMEAELRALTGGDTPAMERYEREYLREFRRQHALASFGELLQAILDTDLFFVGDYHTLRQSQDLARRLLERVAADSRPLVLALEMVRQEHQEHVDAYMRGAIDDGEFLSRIQYRRTWNFDWENYKPLFETARRHGVTVVGINQVGRGPRRSLRERDDAIAAVVLDAIVERPSARFMVLVGDLHLAAPHLPRALDAGLNSRHLQRRRVVVFQNADSLYWTLAERGDGGSGQVVRLGADRFCVMEVPPFVKLQSYLSWERALERWRDASDDGDEASELTLEQSSTQLFEALTRQLGRFFGLPAVPAACEVLTNLDEGFFSAVEGASELDEARVHEIHRLAFGNHSCFVPELDLVYLPYFSVHHASEEAMHVLQERLGSAPRRRGDAFEDFYARALQAAVGFLGSKLVNPLRQAASEDELRSFQSAAARQLHEPRLAFRKLVARFIVQHREHERGRLAGRGGRLQQIYEQELDVTLEVTYGLGYMLGDALAGALVAGTLGPDVLRDLVFGNASQAPSERYFALRRALASPHGTAPSASA